MLASPEPPATPVPAQDAAEAARYALLRRLAPSMRHHLVVNLQPIGMIYEVMDRRLRAPVPDLANVHESAHKINGFARAALDSCLDVVSWLAPEDGVTCTVEEGVRECTGLLATSLGFRGYVLRNRVESLPGRVRRAAIRNLLTAMLIQATDTLQPPAELVLSGEARPDGAHLALQVQPGVGEGGFVAESGYRLLEWSDVQALADAEQVQLARDDATGSVGLLLPWTAPDA
ncbi:hypothetical protein [Ramlibacter sp.]|uniref:hypothetical protein n=1 Tax=Ramlibacter sp. TaxID=1917967 RepID=UPI001833CE6C|nr:hypothetical protein [Ramlibacter sp.]MBA2675901.1 hypothetical protein [Ramlibacter sp.]